MTLILRVRRCIIFLFATITIVVIAVWLFVTPLVADLSAGATRHLRVQYLIVGLVALHGGGVALYLYLRPIYDLGYALEFGSTPDLALIQEARHIAFDAPLYFFVLPSAGILLFSFAVSTIAAFSDPVSLISGYLPASLLATAVVVCASLLNGLVCRQWMRPVLLYTAAQFQSGGHRLNIRTRLFVVLLVLFTTMLMLNGLLGYNQVVAASRQQLSSDAVSRNLVVTSTSGVVLLGIVAAVSYYLSADLVVDLRDMTSRLLRIAHDERVDLSSSVPVLSRDEVGDLVLAYNALQQRVRIQQEQIEGKHRQLTALQSLSYKIGTAQDMPHILEEVIRDVERSFGYHNVSILLVDADSEELYFAASGNLDPALRGRRFRIGQDGVVGRVAATGLPLLIDDVEACEYYIADNTDTRSEMAIPLVIGERVIGVFNVASERIAAFGETDLQIVSALCNQIAIVIENARLFREVTDNAGELERRARNLMTLHNLSTALSGSLRMEEVLNIAAVQLASLFQVAHSMVILFNTEEDEGQIVTEHPDRGVAKQSVPLRSFPVMRWILANLAPLWITDARRSELVRPWRKHIERLGIESMLLVPLVTKGHALGVITLDSIGEQRAFTPEETEICRTIAAQVAVTAENVRLIEALQLQSEMLAQRTREIAAERSKLDAVLRNLADGLVVTNPLGRIVLFNRAFLSLFGLGEEGLAGQFVAKAVPEAPLQQLVVQTCSAGTVQTHDFALADGRSLEGTAALVSEASQENRVVIVLRDVTQEKRVERMKSDFISAVSHELRTPLTPVLGFAKLIRRSFEKHIAPLVPTEHADGQRALDRIEQDLGILIAEVERLSALVENVLFLADLDAGRLTWRMEELDLAAIVRQEVDAQRPMAANKKLGVRLDLPETVPPVSADRERLAQVVRVLLSNAIKFTEVGEIGVSVQALHWDGDASALSSQVAVPGNLPRGRYVLVTVSDTGPGISAQAQRTLFERFGQGLRDMLTDKPSGTGLGLAISRETVSRHGGQIWVRSEPGKGSSFGFVVPCLPKS